MRTSLNICEYVTVCVSWGLVCVCVGKMKDYSIVFVGTKPISQLHINRSTKVCVSVCMYVCLSM